LTFFSKIKDKNELESPVNVDKFLQQIEQVSELLVKVDEEHEFAHRNFQSYLSAGAIIEQKQENLLYLYFCL
jgi:predicted NACHT family NTPase